MAQTQDKFLQVGVGAVNRTVDDWILDSSLSVKDFGAVGDGITDDTTAIQNCINAVATAQSFIVYFPDGEYNFSRLYLHYDAVNNAGFPTGNTELEGRIRLQGAGRMTHNNIIESNGIGTLLTSTETTNASIYCDGDPLGADTNQTNQVQIHDMSIQATNTTSVIKFERVVQNSGLKEVFIQQSGTGSGIDWHTCWINYMADVYIRGGGSGTSDTGLYIRNVSAGLTGGLFRMNNVICDAFATGIHLGHKTYNSGSRLHSIHMDGCQGSSCITGISIGHGINQLSMEGCHVEDCTTGMILSRGASSLNVMTSSYVNNDIGLVLGGATADDTRLSNVLINNCRFVSDASTTKHIDIYQSVNMEGISIAFPDFTGHASATETAITLVSGSNHNVEVLYPKYNANLSTNITNDDRLQTYILENLEVKSSGLSGALSASPFKFIQGSSTGAKPTVQIEQADNDVPFINFETGITPTTNSNHISTANSGTVTGPGDGAWTFSRMVLVQTTDAGGTTDYWLPLFTKV